MSLGRIGDVRQNYSDIVEAETVQVMESTRIYFTLLEDDLPKALGLVEVEPLADVGPRAPMRV